MNSSEVVDIEMIQGSCQCKSIRYEVSTAPIDCCYCHCSVCRKLTGSSRGTYGTIARSKFTWLAGENLLQTYQQNKFLRRKFCSSCGSFMISLHDLDPSNIFISLGCLDSVDNINIDYQQFVDSKANWVSLDKSVKQHSDWPEWVLAKIDKDA